MDPFNMEHTLISSKALIYPQGDDGDLGETDEH